MRCSMCGCLHLRLLYGDHADLRLRVFRTAVATATTMNKQHLVHQHDTTKDLYTTNLSTHLITPHSFHSHSASTAQQQQHSSSPYNHHYAITQSPGTNDILCIDSRSLFGELLRSAAVSRCAQNHSSCACGYDDAEMR